jgi:dipeptidyl aminopeptidase/acylaminoacyl peptidase
VESPKLTIYWHGRAAFADRSQPRFSIAGDGTLVVAKEDPQRPREIWVVTDLLSVAPHWRQLTTIQLPVDNLALGRSDTLQWMSDDGMRIQGLLLRPANAEPNRPLPLVVFPHGGPIFLNHYLFRGWVEGPYVLPFELLAARGIAVLLPNPRGSVGWGSRFVDAILRDHCNGDLKDVLAGVDYCIQQGIADPHRIGIAGWSSSGTLAAWATCVTDRFKAAMVGTGILDLRARHHVKPVFTELFYGDDPYRMGGNCDQRSAVTNAHRVRTPTLIVHGDRDNVIPLSQSLEWCDALRSHGQRVKLVVYPREGHAIRERQHQIDLCHRIVGWFVQELMA